MSTWRRSFSNSMLLSPRTAHPAASSCTSLLRRTVSRASIELASNASPRVNRTQSDVAAFDLLGQLLDDLRHLLEVGIDSQRLAEGVQRALVVAHVLHDHADTRQRAEMARLTGQYLLQVS